MITQMFTTLFLLTDVVAGDLSVCIGRLFKHCLVRLFKLYNSCCPANRTLNAFYLRPLLKVSYNGILYRGWKTGFKHLGF